VISLYLLSSATEWLQLGMDGAEKGSIEAASSLALAAQTLQLVLLNRKSYVGCLDCSVGLVHGSVGVGWGLAAHTRAPLVPVDD